MTKTLKVFCGMLLLTMLHLWRGKLPANGPERSSPALEAPLAEEYKHDRLTKPELQLLLGIETSFELDRFLMAHDVWVEYTREDAERERQSLERPGF